MLRGFRIFSRPLREFLDFPTRSQGPDLRNEVFPGLGLVRLLRSSLSDQIHRLFEGVDFPDGLDLYRFVVCLPREKSVLVRKVFNNLDSVRESVIKFRVRVGVTDNLSGKGVPMARRVVT